MSGPGTGSYPVISKNNKKLADNLVLVKKRLEQSGAKAAAKRIDTVASQPDVIYPELVQQWIDPGRTLSELEESLGKRARLLSAIRNALALAPLIVTWLTLSWASGQYQAVIAAAQPLLQSNDPVTAQRAQNLITTPFLVLWERGFNTGTVFTFSHTAFLDFALLSMLVLLTVAASAADGRAHARAEALVAEVDDVIVPLGEEVRRHRIPVNPQDWAQVVRDTIKSAMDDVESVMNTTQSVVKDVGASLQPVAAKFDGSVATLGQELNKYQQSVASFGTTVQGLSTAAGQVGQATASLASTFGQYQNTADSIDQTIKTLAAGQQATAQTSAQLAGAIAQSAASSAKTAKQLDDAIVQFQATQNALSQATGTLSDAASRLQKASMRLGQATRTTGGPASSGGIIGFFRTLFG